MNNTEKLEKIMDILSIEDFEITRAVDQKESYENLDGQMVNSMSAAETFYPIFEACKAVFEKPFHNVTNLTNENALSPRAPRRGV